MAKVRVWSRLVLITLLAPALHAAHLPEQNINMVAGTTWPGGDPFLRQQNEPSIAVSTRNPLHLLAGANDYRSVDIPFNAAARPDDEETGDAWLGVFKSFDGGNRWRSTLLDGYPQQNNLNSPLNGFQAGADPVVRAANNGLFYYGGIVLNRGTNPLSAVFVSRFIDRNNTEAGDPIAYLDTKLIDKGTAGQFVDKPWIAVAPMTNGGRCTVDGQTFAAQNVYFAYTILVGGDKNVRTKIMFTRSTDCGNTWATPQKLSETFATNQGVNIAVDPSNGDNVYVVWRRFAGGNDPDSVIIAKSTNAGDTFTKGLVLPNIAQPFDQKTTGVAIRSNAYPTMAVDNTGRVYVAFSQRNGMGDGTIYITNSADGLTNWSAPVAVGPIAGGTSNGRGHQFQPAMAFSAGKLTMAWYDLRDDSTIGAYTFNQVTKIYDRSRLLAGNLFLGQPQIVFWTRLSDTSPDASIPLKRRHTLEVYATESTSLGATPTFAPATRITRYKYGSVPPQFNTIQDLQIDPPNLPMFHGGTVPFFGDYIDVAAYVNSGASAGGTARVRHVVWTDNRDVRAPSGSPPDWTKYTPVHSPSLGTTSIFDPTQVPPPCIVDASGVSAAGSRNQNIYTTRVTDGLFVGSPSNAKPLGSIQQAFTIFVQNATNFTALYHLSFAQPLPTPTTASFEQFQVTPTIDVNVPAHSTATRMAFVTAPPHTRVDVIVAQDGGGLTSVISLNPDPTNPDNSAIANNDIFNPDVATPDVATLALANPDVATPDVATPDVATLDLANPDVATPDVATPDVASVELANPDVATPDVASTDIGNASMTDTNWNASNEGTATGGYTVKLFKLKDLPPGVSARLILNKIYDTPVARGCNLGVEHNRQIVASIKNPTLITDVNQLFNPSLTDPSEKNATIWLAPGETGRITVRLMSATPGLILDATGFVTPVSIAQAVNTADANGENRIPSISLTILTASLPDGTVGQSYNAPLSAIGGRNPKTWTATGLPSGLSASGAAIAGTPQQSGTFQVTITVTDSANPPHVKSKTLSLRIAEALVITTTALPDGTQAGFGVPVPDYDFTLTATGGTGARTWSVTPALPTRLTLDASTGRIGPAPVSQTVDQDYTFNVKDSANPPHTASKVLHLRTAPPLVITTQSIPKATVTQRYSATIGATGGRPPYFWQLKGPDQLSIDQNGVISGIFTAPNSSFVTVTVTDSGSPTRMAQRQYDFAAVYPTISSVRPSTAAAGFGQTVALDVSNLTTLSNVSVTFSDGTTTNRGFVFQSASSPQRLVVRLPFVGDNNGTTTNLNTGNLTIALLNGAQQLATGQMILSTTPGAPVIQFIMGLSIPPADNNNFCGVLSSTASITNISRGQGIAVSTLGVDTTGSTLVFTQGTNPAIQVASTCTYSSSGFGIAPVFTVPLGLANGPVSVTIFTSVNDISSPASAPINLTVVNPTYTCIGNQIKLFDNWTRGAVLNGGAAPTFSTNGQTYCLDEVDDYHWNNGNGKVPGTIGLTSVCEFNCSVIGPYPAVGSPGQNNAPNVNWSMKPPVQIVLQGNYSVTDSDPSTWSYDPLVSTLGFSKVFVHQAVVTTPPPPSP